VTCFTQIDPIGLRGGLNLFAFGAADPVNNYDPDGLACRRVATERLECTNIGPGDAETIRDFLGGTSGQRAYDHLRKLSAFRSENCRGGFTPSRCRQVADALSHLVLHEDKLCSRLGERATGRLQRGRVRYDRDTPNFGYAIWPSWFWLGDPAFRPGELANTIAHEEHHLLNPFARHKRTHAVGDACAGSL
jgi:hypothetical protein